MLNCVVKRSWIGWAVDSVRLDLGIWGLWDGGESLQLVRESSTTATEANETLTQFGARRWAAHSCLFQWESGSDVSIASLFLLATGSGWPGSGRMLALKQKSNGLIPAFISSFEMEREKIKGLGWRNRATGSTLLSLLFFIPGYSSPSATSLPPSQPLPFLNLPLWFVWIVIVRRLLSIALLSSVLQSVGYQFILHWRLFGCWGRWMTAGESSGSPTRREGGSWQRILAELVRVLGMERRNGQNEQEEG